MTLPPLPDDGVQLGATAADWRAAVGLAGAALARTGAAEAAYADEMIRMIDEHGPYVVIAPGLALAHARPGPEVLSDGLSVVTLATPVSFGHPYNDPVHVVLGLAAGFATHLSVVAALANVFNDSDAVDRLAAATTPDEVREILGAPDGYPSEPLDAA
ncbi:MAG TPA: PTS sugar transporter subunit IIA [Pseudolysinimonas sp.]|jgi:PTS system ascorbate-specific IIA component|nr:PTS sugar transporter subunit IIA [Pseudolysinimonas sp.]